MENLHQPKKEPPARIRGLIQKFMLDTISEPEQVELDAWVMESDANMKLFEDLTDPIIKTSVIKYRTISEKPLGRTFIPWAAAAAVLLIISFFIYHFNFRVPKENISSTTENDFGSNANMLLLSKGKTIDLGAQPNGAIDKGVDKISDSQLVYKNMPGVSIPQTLITPTGRQFNLELSDGTRISMNAVTKISYPTLFSDSVREVRLTGEAYFEVAHDAKRPFRVILSDSSFVNVTGTHFNINNYTNEPGSVVTLTEGRLSVTHLGSVVQLEPGGQVEITEERINNLTQIDTNAVTCWRNGYFAHNKLELTYLTRQMERWYNVHFVFNTSESEPLFSTFPKMAKIEEALFILKLQKMQYRLSGRKVYVDKIND